MKPGFYQLKFYNHIACMKWYDNKSVMLLGSYLEEITSILTVQRRFLTFNLDLDFLTFNLFDVALANSFIVHKKLQNRDLTLQEFKIYIALKLIASFVNQKLFCPNHDSSKRTKAQRPILIPPSHLPIFLEASRRRTLYSQTEKKNRTFFMCSLCDVAFCLQEERNYFLNYHS